MKVLTDLHHGVLYEALAMLFEDRFGGTLRAWVDGAYITQAGTHWADFPPREIACLTTAEVRSWEPDLVISTVGGTRQAMRGLGGRYVDHVGNAWDQPIGQTILRSVAGDYGVAYHPEFHRLPYRAPSGNRIGAFHASFAHSECRTWFDRAAAEHPEFEFRIYGTPDDPLYPWQVAGAMADCMAIWHCKDADGYGFTVHEAFASGRPVIGHARHYTGKMAEPLFAQGYIEPEAFPILPPVDPSAFDALIDFDAEAVAIAAYLA